MVDNFFVTQCQTSQAQAAIEKAKALSPDNPTPSLLEAQLLASQGQTTAAQEILKSLAAQYPTFEPAQEMLKQLNRP